ncbi:hypothetical protein [Pendulispora albinea]|uniref:Uncharacterized protein n=1 Tax=Pendulispora albinea TaxID=2741071 RepID=A0ABZ2LZG6_9BACT
MGVLRRSTVGVVTTLLALSSAVGVVHCIGDGPGALPRLDGGGPGPGVDGGSPDGGQPGDDSGAWTSLKSIPGLVLWLRADQDVKPGTVGDPVEHWLDQSGAGNDFKQPTVNNRPKYVTFGDGGNERGIEFDGTKQYLINETVLGLKEGAARTFLAVAKQANASARAPLITQADPGESGYFLYALEANSIPSNKYSVDFLGTGYIFDKATSTERFALHEMLTSDIRKGDVKSTRLEYRFNGVQQALVKIEPANKDGADFTPLPTETRLAAFQVNKGGASEATYYGGWVIAEVAVFNRRLTGPDLANAENDLKTRHGL